jgi:hypothetical protein
MDEFIVPNRVIEQPAVDPYLCYWAEWYFLVYLSKIFIDGEFLPPDLIVNSGDAKELVYSVQKDWISGMTHQSWDNPRSVRLGATTRLVLTGSLKDMILIPQNQSYSIGRRLGRGFADMDSRYFSLKSDEYLTSQYDLMKTVKKEIGVSNYLNLYIKLKILLT